MELALWVKVQELDEEWVLAVLVQELDEVAVVDMISVAGDLSLQKTSYPL